jgi:tetratricopeptide (TPR) repeat protein
VFYNYELAVKYHERGELGKAEEYYKRSIDISHYFVPSHLNLGLLYRQMGENKKAVVCFKKVLSMAPFGEIGKIAKENLESVRGF